MFLWKVFAEKMGLEAGWNCHVSLMATESVSSEDSSCRNLSSLGNVQPSASRSSNRDADGGGSALCSTSNPHSIHRSREVTTASLMVASPHFVPRTHSAPSFINIDEVQVFRSGPCLFCVHHICTFLMMCIYCFI